jgi:hypothetical protein
MKLNAGNTTKVITAVDFVKYWHDKYLKLKQEYSDLKIQLLNKRFYPPASI